MRKIFTLVCSVAAMFACASQSSAANQKHLVGELDKAEVVGVNHSIKSAYAPVASSTQARADEAGEWVKVSTGIWYEGPLAARFTDVDAAQWDVDIYQNESKPGWIRLNPYTADTPPAQLLGAANEAWLEICVADPQKAYFLDWTVFNSFLYGSYCPENGWSGTSGYGNLTDGVLTFPAGTVVYLGSEGYYMLNGEIKIVLDKSTYVDYTVSADVPFCSTSADQHVSFTKSDAISTVKMVALEGYYPMNDNNASVVAAQGTDVTPYVGQQVSLGLPGPNAEYSVLYVGLDADGNIKAQGVKYTFIVDDDSSKWTPIGEATYTEGIISEMFTDVDPVDLTCTIEESVERPGYYRLVNPYQTSQFAVSHTHNHYLYIDATDPNHVYVEPSALGVYINSNFGEAATQSWGYQYLDDVATGETRGVWGKLENGVITVPAFRIQLSAYQDAAWLNLFDFTVDPAQAASSFKVVLPKQVPSSLSLISVVDGQAEVLPLVLESDGVFSGEIEVNSPYFYFAELETETPAENTAALLAAVSGAKRYWGAEEPNKEVTEGGEFNFVEAAEPNAFKVATDKELPLAIKLSLDFTKGTLAVQSVQTGVESVNADNTGSEAVEYFNLQGMKINTPAAGQIVIRRQGGKSSMIIK